MPVNDDHVDVANLEDMYRSEKAHRVRWFETKSRAMCHYTPPGLMDNLESIKRDMLFKKRNVDTSIVVDSSVARWYISDANKFLIIGVLFCTYVYVKTQTLSISDPMRNKM